MITTITVRVMQDSALIDIGLPLVLAFVMVGIGLTLQVDDFTRQRRKPLPPLVGTLGSAIGTPLLGFAVVAVFSPPPELAIGIILVAATSGGTTSNVLSYLARGNVALSLVLTVITALLSILTLPFWVGWALNLWGDDLPGGSYVSVSFMDVAGLLVAIIFIPVGIGMIIRNRFPAVAARLERTVSLVSFVVLFGLIIGVVASLGSEAWTMLRQVGPACLVLATLSGLLGLLLGTVFRFPREDHLAMAMEFSIKNVTLSMLIALSTLGSDAMALPSAVYGPVAFIPGLALMYFGRRYVAKPSIAESAQSRQPVVVGYSGSDSSMPAVRWAAAEAQATDRPLRLVMAWGLPTFGISPVSEAADLDFPHAERLLTAAVHTLKAEFHGLEVEGKLVRGKPAQGLFDWSRDAALVVVGNRSRSGLSRLMLGSVSTAIVTHAEEPVVLVREHAEADANTWRHGPVVVAVDGSPGSEAAVTFAVEAAVRRGLKVIALHIVDDQVLAMTTSSGGAATAQQEQLRRMSPALQQAREKHPAVTVTEVIEAGVASEVIVAKGAEAALTVVGSRGHGGFTGMLLGSVSRAVIEHVESPVAVVRPEQP